MDDRARDEFGKLVEAVARLRGPGGCPWDREQTHESLKRYAIEETYEVIDAIDGGEPAKLEDELGDFILQALLHAEIARESGQFDIADVCRTIREKLVRRHPHVFGDVEISGVDDVLHNWEQIKSEEYEHRKSVLDGVPASLPALMRAAKISKKAAGTGFDWPDVGSIIAKLKEETAELEEAIERIRRRGNQGRNRRPALYSGEHRPVSTRGPGRGPAGHAHEVHPQVSEHRTECRRDRTGHRRHDPRRDGPDMGRGEAGGIGISV